MRDTAEIRADFPALDREVNGRRAAFFDGPAGSQVPRAVIDAMAGYLTHSNANTGGAFATSEETDGMLRWAREVLGDFLGGAAEGVVFGQNMTALTYALSRATARDWRPRDEVIVTDLDHQANITPWVQAAEDAGATVHRIPFDAATCLLDIERLESSLGPRTRLVAIGHASNAVGTVNDVARVCASARAAGALSFVDSVHYAPHGSIDVRAIGCDFVACSAYKFFGPHLGVMWGRPELLAELRPYRLPPASDDVPERWETGTLSHESIAGAAAAVEWIEGLAGPRLPTRRERLAAGMRRVEALERPLFDRLLDGVVTVPGLRVFGPPAGHARTPTLAFTLPDLTPRRIAEMLGQRGIFVWDGDFYASTVVDRLGLREAGGLVRVGLAPYNTTTEIDRLVEAVAEMARGG